MSKKESKAGKILKRPLPERLVVTDIRRCHFLDGFPFLRIVSEEGLVFDLTRDRLPSGRRKKVWTLRAQDQSFTETRRYKSVMEFIRQHELTDEAFVGQTN